MPEARFIYVADVYCPWCFGFAPIMQRLAAEHPEFPVHVIGGNLISRPLTLEEDVRRQPGIVEFWREVEKTTGRSLAGAIRAVENREDMRLYSPGADELLAVLRHLAPHHELEQLIMLEDMAYTEGRDLFTPEARADMARRWNIPVAEFERALEQPEAVRATERNLEAAAELMGEITSYPSVLLVRGDKVDAVSRGYVHYETVASRLDWAMRDLGLEPQEETAMCSWRGGCTIGRHGKA
ncbi:MAG: hypothetical protein HDQ94_04525 [Desulfovibrio sp.]|nr:hypothetical protein [Desulfovibrio sp.]